MNNDNTAEIAKEPGWRSFTVLKIGAVIAFVGYLIHDARNILNSLFGLETRLATIIGLAVMIPGLLVVVIGNFIEQARELRGSVLIIWGIILFGTGLMINIPIDNPKILEAIPTEYLRVTKWGFFFVSVIFFFRGTSMRWWEKRRKRDEL